MATCEDDPSRRLHTLLLNQKTSWTGKSAQLRQWLLTLGVRGAVTRGLTARGISRTRRQTL
eukprot:913171-Lingulodinium_polyedra.AAC.1